MALSFPSSSALSERLDRAQVLECAARAVELPTLREAKSSAVAQIRENSAIRRVERLVLLADDTLALVSVGARGGHRIEWKFGRV